MKIICFARALGVGGAERQIVGLACMLQKAGHQVEVLTYHPEDFYAPILKENGIVHHNISKVDRRHLLNVLTEHIKAEQPDYVIAFLMGPSTKACKIHRKWPHFKLVVSERNLNQSYLPHDTWRFLLYRQADKVIANSYAQERFVRKHAPWLSDKLGAIVNFVDTEKFRPAGTGASHSRRIICTTARVHHRKNLLGFIKAAGMLKAKGYDFEIRWYGLVGEDSYYRKCMELIGKLSLEDRFSIRKASDKVDQVYRESDLFCLPSFYEGTPNSMCEAISSGLPVACSNVSDNAIYVRHGINGETFNPKSIKEISAALAALIELPDEKLAEYSQNSRRMALELLSEDRFIKEWLSILEN